VSNLGVAEQLKHVPSEEWPRVLNHILTEFGLEDYGTNAAEGSLCETSEKCVCKIMDYVFEYQYQFMFGNDGSQLVKPYNSSVWEKI
jgi:hypothetical protein